MPRKRLRAVVLGSRFAGLATLTWLRRLYRPSELDITVVDQWQDMIFRPGLVHAMRLGPDQLMATVSVPMRPFWAKHQIHPIHDIVVGIDPNAREVYTAAHEPIPYDVLFVATGSSPRWDAIPGLAQHHQGFCEGYLARHTAAVNMRQPQGRLVIAIGQLLAPRSWSPSVQVGCECPGLESALLWDYRLRQLKERAHAEITLVTPAKELAESGGAEIREKLGQIFHQRGINVITGAQYRRVADSALELGDGTSIPFDRILWIPPQSGSRWLEHSPIAEGAGWVPADAFLNHPRWSEIYAVGDVVSKPWPKMGHAAMVQARVAVHHWAWRQRKIRRKPAPYEPKLLWVLEDTAGTAFFVLSNAFYGGKQQMVYHGRSPYWAKQVFQMAYIRRTGALPVMP